MIPTYDLTNYLVIAALLAFAIWHFTSLIRLSSLRLGSWCRSGLGQLTVLNDGWRRTGERRR
jgi:hypothetical protein